MEKKVVAVIGSRKFTDYELMKKTLDKLEIELIVSGGAIGADTLAEKYAEEHDIPTIIHKPNWRLYGKAAGFIRNKYIVDDADIVVAFWDGKSRGTEHSIDLARKVGKKVIIILGDN